jgi:hypothetical protein
MMPTPPLFERSALLGAREGGRNEGEKREREKDREAARAFPKVALLIAWSIHDLSIE